MLPYINNQDAYDIIASNNYWDDIHYGEVTYTNYVPNPIPAVTECRSYGTWIDTAVINATYYLGKLIIY
ncbi:unnamed protein product [Adineta steineri]|uniref:Uncharacterized protein n=1 Tax=Adineta steineri TaxID=433720 RepID=A0A814ADF5_9BILA|nr:unnamed protein product [Adineta steineri]CAF1606013.1 unnamed protein product [Adineta steineri]